MGSSGVKDPSVLRDLLPLQYIQRTPWWDFMPVGYCTVLSRLKREELKIIKKLWGILMTKDHVGGSKVKEASSIEEDFYL